MRAEIIGKDGNELRVKIYDELTDEEIERYKIGDRLFAVVELFDPDSITIEQRKHIYALFGDFSEYTGYTLESAESLFKVKFMHHEMLDELPSLGTNRMTKTMASKFIEYIVVWFIQNEIPFRKDQMYLPTESSKYIYWATMTRHCVVCGEQHAQIAHFEAVGMGRDRTRVDHTKHHVLALCDFHHREQHNVGWTEFMKKYVVKPVKLTAKQLKELNVRGNYEQRQSKENTNAVPNRNTSQ